MAARLIAGPRHGSISRFALWEILALMTKRLVDLDDTKLAAVPGALGTTTIKVSIDTALDEVLDLVARRQSLLAERTNGSAELADPEARRAAWG